MSLSDWPALPSDSSPLHDESELETSGSAGALHRVCHGVQALFQYVSFVSFVDLREGCTTLSLQGCPGFYFCMCGYTLLDE